MRIDAAVLALALAPAVLAQGLETRLPGGEPVLRMPFPDGVAVYCIQGNDSADGLTHSLPYARRALDFSDPTGRAREIVASAPGTVLDTFTGSAPGDASAGYDFGNHVKVDHGGGWYTLYAHLDDVRVAPGERVAGGQVLGTMGQTGLANGIPHLHFSLHRGDAREPSVSPAVPIHALIAADLDAGAEFALLSGPEFLDHVYASENATGKPLRIGSPARLDASRQAIRRSVGAASGHPAVPSAPATWGEVLSLWQRHGAAWARDHFEARLARDPADLDAMYWLSIVLRRDLGEGGRAKALLERIAAAEPREPAWLLPWTRFRLGIVAEAEGRMDDAERLYRQALAAGDDGSGRDAEARDGLARVAAARGR